MKLLSAQQLRAADQFTIANERIASLDLMERAARGCVNWLNLNFPELGAVAVFCGTGNNGGDGLAIARLLYKQGKKVSCFENKLSEESEDYTANKKRLPIPLNYLNETNFEELLATINPETLIIDALFGSGLNRSVQGFSAKLISKLNQGKNTIISIDIPSGLFAEFNTTHIPKAIIQATYTLTFQRPKLSFLLPEYGAFAGKFHVLDIGLAESFIEEQTSPYNYITAEFVKNKLAPIKTPFVHKGTFGHLLLIAGQEGSMGAAILAAKAALHSGLGKLTLVSPSCGLEILQTSVVEAMVFPAGDKFIEGPHFPQIEPMAIGPGLGKNPQTVKSLKLLLKQATQPLILDADALNILAEQPDFVDLIPKYSILSPHPKEFERLVGKWKNDQEKLDLLSSFSKHHQVYIVLKGAYSVIATPEGTFYFNSTGNPGMATAGSGDVLTGILGSFLAQGFSPLNTALLAVFVHGVAGDFAEKKWTSRVVTAGLISESLSLVFKELQTTH
jgi:ADP-dependent NAD(P)H-hydrate dehydratase / NAD(P)H-hydrate epimerase